MTIRNFSVKKIILLYAVFLILNSCCKYDMTACFTVDKNSAYIGDTLTFINCSDYDGVKPEKASWFFGDETIIHGYEEKEIKHVYKDSGTYNVSISIGGAECGDYKEMEIVILK